MGERHDNKWINEGEEKKKNSDARADQGYINTGHAEIEYPI